MKLQPQRGNDLGNIATGKAVEQHRALRCLAHAQAWGFVVMRWATGTVLAGLALSRLGQQWQQAINGVHTIPLQITASHEAKRIIARLTNAQVAIKLRAIADW